MGQPADEFTIPIERGTAGRTPTAVGPLARLFASARTPLYANAYALLANQVSSAALGFLYWLLAARLYPVEVVGKSSAVISLLLLIAGLAQLGLGNGMVRFVPRAGRHARRLVLVAYATVPVAAAVLSVGFLWVGNLLKLNEKVATGGLSPAVLVGATVLWSVFYFQDGILNGLRKSVWVLVENFLYNVGKIVLLVLGVWLLKERGILGSWFLPTPLAIALVGWLVFGRFLRPGALDAARESAQPLTRREVVTSVTGDHFGNVISETSVRLLPLLVVAQLGAAQNAYFYQAWLVANTLTLAASGMSHSFTAQAAADRAGLATYSRQILRQMLLLLAPVALVIGLASPLVLALFGGRYAEAATLLRWLALTVPLVVFDTWYLAYARVTGRIARVVTLQALSAALLLGVGWVALPVLGITGLGMAWLVSQGAVAAVAAIDARSLLLERPAAGARRGALPRVLSPAELRLLLPCPSASVTAVFAKGGHASRRGEIDGFSAAPSSCDLAVVRDRDAATLSASLRALRDGGACYSEWPAWRMGGVEGVTRRLEKAGFTAVRAYYPAGRSGGVRLLLTWPSAEGYRRAVLRVLADHLPWRALLRPASAVISFALRTGRVPTVAVIAHKPGETAEAPSLDLPDWLMRRLRPLDPDGSPALVMLSGGRPFNKKVHWLVFSGDPPALRWIVKIPQRVEGHEAVRREAALLACLASRAGMDGLALPHVELVSEAPGFPLHVESALVGPRLDALARTTPYPALASRVTAALTSLAGHPSAEGRDAWWDRAVEPWLVRLGVQADALGEQGLVGAVREALSGLDELPLVWAHNDCAPWNMVAIGDRVAIFDWETGRERWLPAVDLVYCLASAAFCADGTEGTAEAVTSYRRLLDPSEERGRVFEESLRSYASHVGIRAEDLPALRVATWLIHTTHDLENLVTGSVRPTSRLLRRSVCLPLLLTELSSLGIAASAPRQAEG